ncbi:hypothetical protein MXMO3_00025 [Maritalea myrionectae]|uniref:Uncharacterized protein n=1 Tax=Maritalea myrionectae TaxID=454601 RepID=A0A2R4M9C5_9HYPH|nr:hypothetical protein [Maritalea myrionectae]AVX02573.1 hypothetical protein MXMO3_00025 [Maritalea myrionectae]
MRIDVQELRRETERELGNMIAVSPAQLGVQIERFGNLVNQHLSQINSSTLDVFPLPTGCGKTTMMIETCRLIAKTIIESKSSFSKGSADLHKELQFMPGVLIVVRTIRDADTIVQKINNLQGNQLAQAWHSENAVSNPTEVPFLVVTHKKYMLAIEASQLQASWNLDQIVNFEMGCRQLTFIDEKIELSQNCHVTLKALRLAISSIDEFGRGLFPTEATYLDVLLEILAKKSDGSADNKHQIVEMADFGCPPDFSALIKYLNRQRLDHDFTGRNDIECRRGALEIVTEALKLFGTLKNGYLMLSKTGADTFLSTSSRIPHRNAIVLDATAELDFEYTLHSEHVYVHSIGNELRNYQNATLNVNYGNRTGKSSLKDNAALLASELYQSLQTQVQPHCQTLVCCHKVALNEFAAVPYTDIFTDTANYGNLDGRNDWSEYDTILVAGLSHRDEISLRLAYMAALGPQTEEWLNSQYDRVQVDGHDPIAKLKLSANVTSLVQALNRIRIRRIIDEEGNCAPCNAYLLLGAKTGQGGEVLKQVISAMPNIVVSEFEIDGQATKRKPKTQNRNRKLLDFFSGTRLYGKYSIAEVTSETRLSSSTLKRIIRDLNNNASELSQAATAIGLSHFSSTGRSGSSYFQYEGQQ